MTRTFYEFFAGGGMARIGLGAGWRCLVANDLDPDKCAAYRANFGGEDLIEGDVHDLSAGDLPGRADLAWASFPCQDLSLAGARGGLSAGRSGSFFGFWRLIEALRYEGRAPRTVVIENVSGLSSSSGGADLAVVLNRLADAGYKFDAQVLDAASFLPQSRPRLFIIAWSGRDLPEAGHAPASPQDPLRLSRAHLTDDALAAHRPLALDPPPGRNVGLSAIVEDAPCFTQEKTKALLEMAAPLHQAKLSAALAQAETAGAPVYGAGFRRMRGGKQRLEMRFDLAGCLRTPAGGSSRQILIIARPGGRVDARLMTGREAARLMGLPDDYRLPERANRALKLCGDGVAVPVVRHIAERALEPLLARALEPATDAA
ncbi:MAG: DNA cytosine methyltransferase [Pseudomonadota bacterium]